MIMGIFPWKTSNAFSPLSGTFLGQTCRPSTQQQQATSSSLLFLRGTCSPLFAESGESSSSSSSSDAFTINKNKNKFPHFPMKIEIDRDVVNHVQQNKNNIKLVGSIDQGTSSTRFMIFTQQAKVMAYAQVEHKQYFPEGEDKVG
jgi:hypothetical protein